MTIRMATAADAATFARFRVGMFRDMGLVDDRDASRIRRATAAYLARAIPAGAFVGFVAEEGGVPVAGAGLLVRVRMPAPLHPRGTKEAHVLNVFTEEAHRGRGHARALMNHLVRWCGRHGFGRLTLHASKKGKPLYKSLGFRKVEEFRLDVMPSTRRAGGRPRR